MCRRVSFDWKQSQMAAVSLLLLTPAVFAQSKPAQSDARETAMKFAISLSVGKYAEAAGLLDDQVAAVLPVEKLQAVWETTVADTGGFKSLGEPSATEASGYRIVVIPATFEATTLDLQITINSEGRVAGFYIRPSGGAGGYQPPPYDRSEKYKETDVEFGEAPWIVKGKLTRPDVRSLVPAVVLVHGSGPHDEDETIGSNKPFRDLAAGLSSNGVAVLRYQKRTHAYKLRLATQKTITVREETIDDALAAMEFLRNAPGVDQSRVFVLGHSMGATLGPQIAAEAQNAAGVILLAGTARDFFDVLEDQLAYIASLPGGSQKENRTAYEEVKKAVARVRAGENTDEIRILGVPATYWNELNDYGLRSAGIAKELKCRLFIAGGGRDYQITRKDFDLYRKTLRYRQGASFHWYKRLNHLFAPGKERATPQEYLKANNVDEQVIKDLAEWIRAE